MEIGSVRFFKRLIAFSLVVVLPLSLAGCSAAVLALYLTSRSAGNSITRMESRIAQLEEQITVLSMLQSELTAPGAQSGASGQTESRQLAAAAISPAASGVPASLPGEGATMTEPSLFGGTVSETTMPMASAAPAAGPSSEPTSQASSSLALALAAFRPDFFREPVAVLPRTDKVVYLTFDDGPSARTAEILRILEQNHVKASFFVITRRDAASEALLRQAAAGGHAIGMHSDSHNMSAVYASPLATLTDFSRNYDYIRRVTGQSPAVFRYAGGSSNAMVKESGRFESLIEMNRRGFVCFDWNASTGDAASSPLSAARIVRNAIESAGSRQAVVLLAHDANSKTATVTALPEIIRHFRNAGYRFGTLGPDVEPILYASTRKALATQAG